MHVYAPVSIFTCTLRAGGEEDGAYPMAELQLRNLHGSRLYEPCSVAEPLPRFGVLV